MPAETPGLAITSKGEVNIVEIVDPKAFDEPGIQPIQEQLDDLVSRSGTGCKILMDFSVVPTLTSSALGVLISVHRRVRNQEGQLRMCGFQPAVEDILAITKLNGLFKISRSHTEALDSMALDSML